MRINPRRSTTTPAPYSVGMKFGSVGCGAGAKGRRRPNGSGSDSKRNLSPSCSLRTRATATTDFSLRAIASTRTFSIGRGASMPAGSCAAGAEDVRPGRRAAASDDGKRMSSTVVRVAVAILPVRWPHPPAPREKMGNGSTCG